MPYALLIISFALALALFITNPRTTLTIFQTQLSRQSQISWFRLTTVDMLLRLSGRLVAKSTAIGSPRALLEVMDLGSSGHVDARAVVDLGAAAEVSFTETLRIVLSQYLQP